ncbi:hydroxysqualene dehydroxylase HpnE [Limibacillus sp. MBR-115]|jgi:squalene-associated FAD-dependent desaturase|uniref:hydroxysqualene dehydroxylase HpnE n=1 Tax=Limibacillus sp. MBR-115 TaxID=3156465 RepID=UPI003390EFCC
MSRVHVIGCGLAGLSAAVRLAAAGLKPLLYEQSGHAGGRCRSYRDPALECLLDNGNHLLLSANREVLAYLDLLDARRGLRENLPARFPFVDLADTRRWALNLESGRLKGALDLCKALPGVRPRDLSALLRFLFVREGAVVTDLVSSNHALYRPLIEPLTLAVMNGPPEAVSASLLARVLRQTLFKGASTCRPLLPAEGLGPALVEPALAFLAERNIQPLYHHRLKDIGLSAGGVDHLEFAAGRSDLKPGEAVVLAIPPWGCDALQERFLPQVETKAIVNLHYRLPKSVDHKTLEPFLGVLGGRIQWIFRRGDVVSVTISDGERWMADAPETLAQMLWPEVATALQLGEIDTPPFRVIKERRATPLQSPAAAGHRRGSRTAFSNLFIAGDWCDTGYPATIESAVLSGRLAAAAILSR